MNLLLILSALLSALGGVFVSSPVAAVQVEHSSIGEQRAVPVAIARAATRRPVMSLPSVRIVARFIGDAAFRPVSPVALFAERRRE